MTSSQKFCVEFAYLPSVSPKTPLGGQGLHLHALINSTNTEGLPTVGQERGDTVYPGGTVTAKQVQSCPHGACGPLGETGINQIPIRVKATLQLCQ